MGVGANLRAIIAYKLHTITKPARRMQAYDDLCTDDDLALQPWLADDADARESELTIEGVPG